MEKSKVPNKFIYWTPRLLGIIYILFLTLFSLDVFQPGLSPREVILGLFIHNIPSLILIVALILSWKQEIYGATVFTLAGLLYISLLLPNFQWFMLPWIALISGPAFLIGVLFFIGWRNRYKNLGL